jgi:hypothetical protein
MNQAKKPSRNGNSTRTDLYYTFTVGTGRRQVLHSRLFAAAIHVIGEDYLGENGRKWQADHVSPTLTFGKYIS